MEEGSEYYRVESKSVMGCKCHVLYWITWPRITWTLTSTRTTQYLLSSPNSSRLFYLSGTVVLFGRLTTWPTALLSCYRSSPDRSSSSRSTFTSPRYEGSCSLCTFWTWKRLIALHRTQWAWENSRSDWCYWYRFLQFMEILEVCKASLECTRASTSSKDCHLEILSRTIPSHRSVPASKHRCYPKLLSGNFRSLTCCRGWNRDKM